MARVPAQMAVRIGSEAAELAAEIIAFTRQSPAGYKAPKSVDFEVALPRHPSGKLCKQLLLDPYWAATGRTI